MFFNLLIIIQLGNVLESWKWTHSTEIIVGKAARPYIKYEHQKVNDDDNNNLKGRDATEEELEDKVHMAFTDGHPRDVPTNSVYYACLVGNKLKRGE